MCVCVHLFVTCTGIVCRRYNSIIGRICLVATKGNDAYATRKLINLMHYFLLRLNCNVIKNQPYVLKRVNP